MTGRGEMTLGEMFAEEEARRVAETRREREAERAAWNALSDEERAERIAAGERKLEEFEAALEAADDDEETDEDEDEDDEPAV